MNHVLITGEQHTQHGVYHDPDPENPDEPKCSKSNRGTGTNWVRKDPDVIPTYRHCKDCSGERKRPYHKGPGKLANKLEAMDPDEVTL